MHSAEILNYIVYYIVSQYFETRGRQEHHQIMLDVLKWIKVPETCSTVYKLRVSRKHLKLKTRKGGLQNVERKLSQRTFATGGP